MIVIREIKVSVEVVRTYHDRPICRLEKSTKGRGNGMDSSWTNIQIEREDWN